MQLRVLITSGATSVPIDGVRCITNKAKGRTGAQIAEAFLAKGAQVTYVHSEGAILPFADSLDLSKHPGSLQNAIKVLQSGLLNNLKRVSVDTFDSYSQQLETLVPHHDVVILSMAVSDYGPVPVSGKISTSGNLTLELHPLPKLISRVKTINPKCFLVGFKLMVSSTPVQLTEVAYKSLLGYKGNLVVANSVDEHFKVRHTAIVTVEKTVIPVRERHDLPGMLCEAVVSRYSKLHFTTVIETGNKEAPPELLRFINHWQQLALFPPYQISEPDGPAFGAVALREGNGFWVTGRGSSKAKPHLVYVHLPIDWPQRELRVIGGKPTLNAATLAYLFSARAEVNAIVHTHYHVPDAPTTMVATNPGTADECCEITPVMQGDVFNQKEHGAMFLLPDLGSFSSRLQKYAAYGSGVDYDMLYGRFLGRDSIGRQMLAHGVGLNANILDLAAGTGEHAATLRRLGYVNITLLDGSQAMLNCALQKHPADKIICMRLPWLPLGTWDCVTMRQAINYLTEGEITALAVNLRQILMPGGTFLCNTFEPFAGAKANTLTQDSQVIREGSISQNGQVEHGQAAHCYITGRHCYDYNVFFNYSPQRLAELLTQPGYQISVVGSVVTVRVTT